VAYRASRRPPRFAAGPVEWIRRSKTPVDWRAVHTATGEVWRLPGTEHLDDWLTIHELAARLGVTLSAVRKRIVANTIPSVRIGSRVLISPDEVPRAIAVIALAEQRRRDNEARIQQVESPSEPRLEPPLESPGEGPAIAVLPPSNPETSSVSIPEFARRFATYPLKVRQLIDAGQLKSFTVGNRARIPLAELDNFVPPVSWRKSAVCESEPLEISH
jgi:excisionase family DNA binding protein